MSRSAERFAWRISDMVILEKGSNLILLHQMASKSEKCHPELRERSEVMVKQFSKIVDSILQDFSDPAEA